MAKAASSRRVGEVSSMNAAPVSVTTGDDRALTTTGHLGRSALPRLGLAHPR